VLDRRDFLKAAGATVVGSAVTTLGSAPASAALAAEPPQTAFLDNNPRWVVRPFPLHRVSIMEGTVFAEKRNRVLQYASAYPVDRVLHNFRVTAGLPTATSATPGPSAAPRAPDRSSPARSWPFSPTSRRPAVRCGPPGS
jgi:hypothetical protein